MAADSTHWYVADLSLGAWVGHQAARRILEQLANPIDIESDAPGFGRHFRRSGSYTIEDAGLIGKLVDAESKGDTGVIAALALAERTIEALRRVPGHVLLVLAPRFGHVWRPDDAAYVRFLAHGIGGVDARLVLVAADAAAPVLPPGLEVDWWNSPPTEPPASAPPESLAGLIPDTPTRTLAGQTGLLGLAPAHGAELLQGRLLIDPALRSRPAAPLRRQFDKLGALEGI